LFSLTACTEEETPDQTIDYNDFEEVGSFETALSKEEESYLLYFYSETCSICVNVKSDVLSFFDTNQELMKVYMMDVYNTEGNYRSIDLGEGAELVGTPTLILVENGAVRSFFQGSVEIEQYMECGVETDIADCGLELEYNDFEFLSHFDNALLKEEATYLLYFYSETCGHCQNIKVDVLQFINEHQDTIKVYLVDARTVEGSHLSLDLGDGETLSGTPTLVVVEGGTVTEYFVGTPDILGYIETYTETE
jgi:thioredoxin-related protein